jgi:glycosyltransferase involved in cell wall biosynthesis
MSEILHRARTPRSFIPAKKTDQLQNSAIKRLSIIIPVYNEEKTIGFVLEKINNVKLSYNIEKEIIIVDDCSTDKTEQIVTAYISANPLLRIEYLYHPANRGKGAAIHTGIRQATGEYLLVQDADLEYDPKEYKKLLQPIIDGHADVVFGSRFMGGSAHRILFFWHSIGNRFLTFLSNAFTNLNLTDMETGYKVFRTDLIQGLGLREERFGFEPEVTAKISRVPGLRLYEVGISYYGRTYKEGKKIKWKDGVRTVFCIIRYAFFDRGAGTVPQREKVVDVGVNTNIGPMDRVPLPQVEPQPAILGPIESATV